MRQFLLLLSAIAASLPLYSQNRTIGLTKFNTNHQEGYYLFTPLNSKSTFLINECGELVNQWNSNYTAGATQWLLPDGNMLRCGFYPPPSFGAGRGGIIEKFDWNGNVTWKFILADREQALHHDIHVLPNGNILAIVWEQHDSADAVANGRKPQLSIPSVWSENIIEIKPHGTDSSEIVWQWRAWDHIIQDYDSTKANYGAVGDHPELFDLNFVGNNPQDWFHFNSVDYNAELDQIVISAHSTDEILVIDHATSATESAGHSAGRYGKGGDILYRWGNPAAYRRGTTQDKQLFKQHHAHWVKPGFANAGKIMVFNNGTNRTGTKFSSIDLIDPPVNSNGTYDLQTGMAFRPDNATVLYKAPNPSDFYAMNLSAAQSLEDSSLFITSGPQGRFFEVNRNGEIVWEYINPITANGPLQQGESPTGYQNNVFRCQYYPLNYSAFSGKDLSPDSALEGNALGTTLCEIAHISSQVKNAWPLVIYPNPVQDQLHISNQENSTIHIFSPTGMKIKSVLNSRSISVSEIPPGLYFLEVARTGQTWRGSFIKE